MVILSLFFLKITPNGYKKKLDITKRIGEFIALRYPKRGLRTEAFLVILLDREFLFLHIAS